MKMRATSKRSEHDAETVFVDVRRMAGPRERCRAVEPIEARDEPTRIFSRPLLAGAHRTSSPLRSSQPMAASYPVASPGRTTVMQISSEVVRVAQAAARAWSPSPLTGPVVQAPACPQLPLSAVAQTPAAPWIPSPPSSRGGAEGTIAGQGTSCEAVSHRKLVRRGLLASRTVVVALYGVVIAVIVATALLRIRSTREVPVAHQRAIQSNPDSVTPAAASRCVDEAPPVAPLALAAELASRSPTRLSQSVSASATFTVMPPAAPKIARPTAVKTRAAPMSARATAVEVPAAKSTTSRVTEEERAKALEALRQAQIESASSFVQ